MSGYLLATNIVVFKTNSKNVNVNRRGLQTDKLRFVWSSRSD